MSFYSSNLREQFTNREAELVFLQSMAEDLLAGKARRLAIWGLRRVGKTLVILEHFTRLARLEGIQPVYMNFEDICTSPEVFAQRYIGLTTYWGLDKGRGEIDAYLTIERLLETIAGRSQAAGGTAASVLRELNQSKPDQALLLKLAFDYPEKLANELDQKFVLCLDEFTEISTLGNYPGVRDPLKHFRASLANQANAAYIVAGSAMTAMMKLFQSPDAPLFLQFETLALEPFPRPDAETLIRKLGGDYTPAVYAEFFRFTGGYPFYITALMQRLKRLELNEEAIDVQAVRYGFLLETLWRGGQIYNYCRYVYDLSLQRARGYGMLKAILQFMAEEEGFRLSEIAHSLRKTPSAVREYLRSLIEVDLVEEHDRIYRYRDPVLRFWVAYTSKGIELDAFPRKEDLSGLVADLEERFQQAAGDLGRAKEAEVRELIRKFAGQIVRGEWFGVGGNQAESFTLPIVRFVDGYISPDGQVELDALAECDPGVTGEGDKPWAVSLKWRNRRAGIKELKRLAGRAAGLGARAWLISRAGFTPDAVEFAAREKILISSGEDLSMLAKRLEPG